MKKQFSLLTLISILLVACTPQVTVTSEVTVTLTPQVENASAIATPTIEELTPEKTIDEIAKEILDGISTLDGMTLEQANEVRSVMAKLLNSDGGVYVTFDIGSQNPAYLSPETFTLRQLEDGKSEEEQSIQMNHEIKVDSDGYLWVANLQGELVRIEGSVGIDWNAIIDNPQSTEIDWPRTPAGNSGLPEAQWFLTLDEGTAYKKVVLLDKTVGEFFLKEFSGGNMVDTLRFYQIITDENSNPLYARLFLASPAGKTSYLEEGNSTEGQSRAWYFPENGSMLSVMEENSVYLIGIETNQATITDFPNISSGYSGVISENDSGKVLLGNQTDQNNLLFILMRMLIKTKP